MLSGFRLPLPWVVLSAWPSCFPLAASFSQLLCPFQRAKLEQCSADSSWISPYQCGVFPQRAGQGQRWYRTGRPMGLPQQRVSPHRQPQAGDGTHPHTCIHTPGLVLHGGVYTYVRATSNLQRSNHWVFKICNLCWKPVFYFCIWCRISALISLRCQKYFVAVCSMKTQF